MVENTTRIHILFITIYVVMPKVVKENIQSMEFHGDMFEHRGGSPFNSLEKLDQERLLPKRRKT